MSSVERFWANHVTAGESRPTATRDCAAFAETLPVSFRALLLHGEVHGIDAPGFHVGDVGDWLEHAWERHLVMQALAEASANPRLTEMVPFGDTEHGFEVALERSTGRVVWLDPSRFDCGDDAVVSVAAETFGAWLEGFSGADLRSR